jgi:hypothetical protein
MPYKDGFDHHIEKLYRSDINNVDIKQIRTILYVFSFLYALFSISDYYLLKEYLNVLLFIRFCIVIPMFLVTVFLTYKKFFIEMNQRLMMFNFILAGAGISVMLIIKPDNFIYYGGMFMIYFSGYLLIKLDYVHAAVGGWITFVLYFIGYVLYHGIITSDLIYSSMFFMGANIIGMVGSYNFEVIKRKNFLSSLKINRKLQYQVVHFLK